MSNQNSKPVKVIRRKKGIRVAIFKNHGEHGNFYSAVPERSYKSGNDYKSNNSYGDIEINQLVAALRTAEQWIAAQEEADSSQLEERAAS